MAPRFGQDLLSAEQVEDVVAFWNTLRDSVRTQIKPMTEDNDTRRRNRRDVLIDAARLAGASGCC